MSAQVETEAIQDYVPFTPFQEGYAFEAEPSALSHLEHFETAPAVTPFQSEYHGVEFVSPAGEELGELLFDLYDAEFDEVLGELAHEAWEAYTERAEQLGETATQATAEEFLHEWSEPVRRQSATLLENIAAAVSEHDVESMSEAQFEDFFDRFEPAETGLEAHFEDFLGKLFKKVKRVAKKAVALAKKGVALIPGLGALLSKLKALVQPLLDRVLRTALDKLPPTLRPLAQQVAGHVLGGVAAAPAAATQAPSAPAAAPATPDVSDVQQEFDLELAQLLLAADETERELVVTSALQEAEPAERAPLAELHDARARLAEDLEAGVEPQQALEEFIPAVMAVLPIARTVMGLIGRGRVVSFVAKHLAPLIGRYAPPESAQQLSRAIADAGLRMLSLEASADGSHDATEALVHTVEETVSRVAGFDEVTLEDPALLEAAVAQAFGEAAAQNFPPQLILPELHETTLPATWVALPRGRRRKYYKKYTHVFDVEITPQIAGAIQTFGGTPLAAFLRDALGVAAPVRAKVHVFQAMHGTTLPRLARFERRAGARGLHPLTVAAAGMLLGQPGLGRDVPGEFRSTRGRIAAGQRFYFLDVAGARPLGRRTSEVNVALNFRKDEFRVATYLSEAEAQAIAGMVRKRDVTGALVAARRVYATGVASALGGDVRRRVKVLTESVDHEDILGRQVGALPGALRAQLAGKVTEWVAKALAEHVAARGEDFVAASEDPADGVTVIVQITNPPGAPALRRLLSGAGGGGADLGLLFQGQPTLSARTLPGFHRA
jgi:hypothetical protein